MPPYDEPGNRGGLTARDGTSPRGPVLAARGGASGTYRPGEG